MAFDNPGMFSSWRDAYLMGGARTPFTDLNGALSSVSPIDLGVKAARAANLRHRNRSPFASLRRDRP